MTARGHDAAAMDGAPGVLDEAHLGRITLGDRALEREVLQIFVRQSTIMLGRLVEAEPRLAKVAAHTLIGSASGIGAWRVARAAERFERAAGVGGEAERGAAMMELKAATVEANAAIGARLNSLAGGP